MDESTNDQRPSDEPVPNPDAEPKSKPEPRKHFGRLIKVIRPFGGWIRDSRMGQGRIVFQKSDVLTAAIVGYETVNGIETAKLVVLGPPPGIPIIAWGVPVAYFTILGKSS